jgi:hypothetical protein
LSQKPQTSAGNGFISMNNAPDMVLRGNSEAPPLGGTGLDFQAFTAGLHGGDTIVAGQCLVEKPADMSDYALS